MSVLSPFCLSHPFALPVALAPIQYAHRAFCTLAIRFLFARLPISLLIPECFNPLICAIKTDGTTSWFLDPISTAVRTRNSSDEMYRRSVASSFIFARLLLDVGGGGDEVVCGEKDLERIRAFPERLR